MVLFGFSLMGGAIYCVAVLALALVSPFAIWNLTTRSPRWQRAVLLIVLSACVAVFVAGPGGALIDLHIIGRVYLSGGPVALNHWAQEILVENGDAPETRFL